MEFQAVIMAAGKGSRMMEVTWNLPKCLLPVGNIPVIESSLHMLKETGIREVIVLVPETEKNKIQDVIENKFNLKLDIVPIPKNEDFGTADSLRYIKDKIKTDIIVLSCDLVTDFELQKMVNLHRTYDSSLTMLLAPWSKALKDAPVPGHKGKHKQEKDIIGLEDTGRLVFVNSEADFENGVPMKLSVLMQHPVVQVFSNLMDAHVYVMKKSLVDFVTTNKHISTLKGEFLPVIIGKQFTQTQDLASLSVLPNTSTKDSGDFQKSSQKMCLKTLALQLSSSSSHWGTLDKSYVGDKMKCYAYIDREAFCIRANTLVDYVEANRQVVKHFARAMGMEPKTSNYPKSQVDGTSSVGEECELLDKASVKQSVIGNRCHLKEKVKITNSIIMDGVTIQSGCTIQGSIICNNVVIGSGCELKNCVIGPDQKINDSLKLNNEVLQGTYQLMEI